MGGGGGQHITTAVLWTYGGGEMKGGAVPPVPCPKCERHAPSHQSVPPLLALTRLLPTGCSTNESHPLLCHR